jgi:ferredoxin
MQEGNPSMAKIYIRLDDCLYSQNGCWRCIQECPMQLLKFEPLPNRESIMLDVDLCIECRNCEVTCPSKCIKVES